MIDLERSLTDASALVDLNMWQPPARARLGGRPRFGGDNGGVHIDLRNRGDLTARPLIGVTVFDRGFHGVSDTVLTQNRASLLQRPVSMCIDSARRSFSFRQQSQLLRAEAAAVPQDRDQAGATTGRFHALVATLPVKIASPTASGSNGMRARLRATTLRDGQHNTLSGLEQLPESPWRWLHRVSSSSASPSRRIFM